MKFLTHLHELTTHTVPTLTNAETHLERERERESATLHKSNGFVTQRVSLMSKVAEEDDDDDDDDKKGDDDDDKEDDDR